MTGNCIVNSTSEKFCSAIFATDRCNTGRTAVFSQNIFFNFQLFEILQARPLEMTANLQVMQRN